jgi:ABC-type phosphate transport system permease subunit
MTNKHCEFWEEIVSSEDEKKAVLDAAAKKGLQWVSTSRVEIPFGFAPGVYRMRFAKRPERKVIKFAGYDPTEKKLGRR